MENIEVLAHSSNDQPSMDSEYYNRIGDTLHQLIYQYTYNYPIAVIATATDVNALNSRLVSFRGRHIFPKQVALPNLEMTDRELVLRELTAEVERDALDFKKVALLTEGYTQGDLIQLFERAVFYAFRTSNKLYYIIKYIIDYYRCVS